MFEFSVSIQFVDDQVCWLYVKQAEQFRAEKALMKIIQQQSFQLEQGFDDVVSSTQWKRLCQNLCSSGNPQMFVDVSTDGLSEERKYCQQFLCSWCA